jgi:D-alanine-D-alanine ligase-like ATP-grasp enzyme
MYHSAETTMRRKVSTFNAELFYAALKKRGISLSRIDDIVLAKSSNQRELFYDIYSLHTPHPFGAILRDKFYTKQFLRSISVSVANGVVFHKNQTNAALRFAETLGYPVVIKPPVGSHGDYVFVGIEDKDALHKKLQQFFRRNKQQVLIEKHISGQEYRLFITRNNFFAAVLRTPARIVGDGKHTISELITKENHRRINPRTTCLCIIPIDSVVREHLRKQKRTLVSIPKKGEYVSLRENSNVSTGGNCYDVTDTVHSSVKKLAEKILAAFSPVPFIGIDLLCQDITKPLREYYVCELDSAPGLSLHMLPEKGRKRDVATAITDTIFLQKGGRYV